MWGHQWVSALTQESVVVDPSRDSGTKFGKCHLSNIANSKHSKILSPAPKLMKLALKYEIFKMINIGFIKSL